MKKFFLFIVFLVAFVLLINGAKNEQAIFIFDGDYSVYGVNYSGEVGSKISLGCGEEVSCNKSEVEKVIKGFNEKIYGVTVKLANGKTIEEILHILNAKIVRNESFLGRDIYYCYSQDNNNFVMENGKKINYQISIKKDVVVIGSPLILGSY